MELGDIDGVDIQIAAASEARRGAAPPDLALVGVAVPRRPRAARGRASTRPSAWPRRRWRSASAARPRTPCTTTRRRCSTSAASRAGWPRSRAPCAGSSSSTRRSRPGAARWRCCWSSSGARTRRAPSSTRSPRGGFAALPRDANWLIAITLLAEVCGALGDAARAAELYRLLEPYAGRNVVVGRNATCNGAASRLLGSSRRRWATGSRRGPLRRGGARCTRRWARGPGSRTRRWPAELLLARGAGRGTPARATLLADAIVVADALGMVVLAERARRLVPAPV